MAASFGGWRGRGNVAAVVVPCLKLTVRGSKEVSCTNLSEDFRVKLGALSLTLLVAVTRVFSEQFQTCLCWGLTQLLLPAAWVT